MAIKRIKKFLKKKKKRLFLELTTTTKKNSKEFDIEQPGAKTLLLSIRLIRLQNQLILE